MGYFSIVFVSFFFFQLVKRRIWAFENINTMFYFPVWLLRMGREELWEWPEEPILRRLWVFLSHVLLGAINKRQTPLCDPAGRGKRIVHFSKGLVADLPGIMNSSPLTEDCTPRALSSARGKWYQEREDKLKRAHTNLLCALFLLLFD